MALDAIFGEPGSEEAGFVRTGEMARPIRIIRTRPDRSKGYGRITILPKTILVEIQASDVPDPQEGDRIAIGTTIITGEAFDGEWFTLRGEPLGDVEGLSWTCAAEPMQ